MKTSASSAGLASPRCGPGTEPPIAGNEHAVVVSGVFVAGDRWLRQAAGGGPRPADHRIFMPFISPRYQRTVLVSDRVRHDLLSSTRRSRRLTFKTTSCSS